jgi:enolase-phosphatase E1
LSQLPPKAVLFDVEGTTTSIAFVADALFPYAREHLAAFVARNREAVAPILADVTAVEPGDPVATLTRWIDEDRKATPLKTLQGMIWREGYEDGTLKGHVYPDSAAAFRRLRERGVTLAIYSSGSIEAQTLLFGHSTEGDLAPLFAAHFDTTSGPKREAASYARIAGALALAPGNILFVSDTPEEVAAACAAGLQAIRIDRDHHAGDISSLDELLP